MYHNMCHILALHYALQILYNYIHVADTSLIIIMIAAMNAAMNVHATGELKIYTCISPHFIMVCVIPNSPLFKSIDKSTA